MVSADVQFRVSANAAAEQFRRSPAYVSYHVIAKIDIPALRKHEVIDRDVETRVADDFAAIQDMPRGQRQYGQSFPLIPTFDALSYFSIEYTVGRRDVLAHVKVLGPITFSAQSATHPGIAAVATTLRNYYAHYADDSTTSTAHLLMDPLRALTTGNDSSFYLHDLYIDTSTNLPSQVTYAGPDDLLFTIDYTTVETHWLVNHISYTRSFFAPFHMGRTHFTADAVFDRFVFPLVPADARLSSTPAVAPVIEAPTHVKSTTVPKSSGL